jgi:hypothetical protein
MLRYGRFSLFLRPSATISSKNQDSAVSLVVHPVDCQLVSFCAADSSGL